MKRTTVLVFAIVSYLAGAGAYFIGLGGFLANLLGRYSINAGSPPSVGMALATNIGLILLFGLPHSLMARQRFKQWWTRLVPAPLERSIFMLQAGLLTLVLIWQWQPMTGTVWTINAPAARMALTVVYWSGWLIALIATFLIDHFELTGLRQAVAYLRDRQPRYPSFRTPLLYKVVRHPMQLGVLLAFWSTPEMTAGRLVFAAGMTLYIIAGLHFEERDLVRRFGDAYRAYQQQTPMLFPIPMRRMIRALSSSGQRTADAHRTQHRKGKIA